MSQLFRGREFSPEWREKIRRGVSKLTDEQAAGIKALLAKKVSQYAIAERFGVHQGTVSNIARGICYAHVAAAEVAP